MANDANETMRVRPHAGTSDRRDFVARAAAGLSLGVLGTALPTAGAAGQDATPAGSRAMASASDHYVLADEDAEAIWFLGCLALIKGVGSQTGGVLASVEFLHPPGFATALHVHHLADESFYVLGGAMRGVCGGREWRA